jgi:hypothetical protein
MILAFIEIFFLGLPCFWPFFHRTLGGISFFAAAVLFLFGAV